MSLENKIIDYQTNKKDIEHWVALKGEYRYEAIIDFLVSKNIECNWMNVTYYIKYDKRILINSFKYIVFLEEMYKSFISKCNLKAKVSGMNFQNAYYEFVLLGDKACFDGVDINKMAEYKKSINAFRNKVVHNNVLLNQKFNGVSLEEVLKQFSEILPMSYRAGFIRDINSCSKGLLEEYWHIEL